MSENALAKVGSVTTRMLDVLKTGDLSRLSEQEQLIYYVHECERMGLDPAARPLEWARLQGGKLALYAKRVAGDMLAAKHRVTVALTAGPEVRDFGGTKLLFVAARASMPDGRSVEDVATLPLQDLANAVMKVTTKCIRRATLRLCGWGGLDESELETIPGAVRIEAPRAQVAVLPEPETPDALVTFREHVLHARETADEHGEVHLGPLTYAAAAAIWIDHRVALRTIDPAVATDAWKELLAVLPDPGGKKTRHAELNRAVHAAEPKGPPPTGTDGPAKPANDPPADEDPERAAIEGEPASDGVSAARAWIQRAAGFRVVERALASWAAHRGEFADEYDRVEAWLDAWLAARDVGPEEGRRRKEAAIVKHADVLARGRRARVRAMRDALPPVYPARVA